MEKTNPETHYAPAQRSSDEKLRNEMRSLNESDIIRSLMEGIPDLVLVLNKNREIVAVNRKASLVFFEKEAEDVLGTRLGEALNCQYSTIMDGGCGTSQFCSVCGAVNAMEKTRKTSNPAEEECRITRDVNGKKISIDLKVNSKIVSIGDNEFILFHVKDISNEKRREVLERIFFHDILNTGSAIKGLAEILPKVSDLSQIEEIEEALISSSDQLLSEIQLQRDLTLAEDGKLKLKFELTSVNDMLRKTCGIFSNHELLEGKSLKIDYLEEDISLIVDQSAIVRSLVNLIKNALEASSKEQTVFVNFEKTDSELKFDVKNENLIPHSIQLQIFQRSFSKKEVRGRGIGTYSVKLIMEKYLEGEVRFISNEKDRTVFTISLPHKYEFISKLG